MNIYVIEYYGGEYEFICARSIIEALKVQTSVTGMMISDFDWKDNIYELSRREWHNYFIENEDGTKTSFSKYMETATQPELFCSTVN